MVAPAIEAEEYTVAFEIDTSTTFGADVIKRLANQKLAWLTTVDSNGTPQPNPVWFIWDDGVIFIFSKTNQAKLNNIHRSDLPDGILDRYAERYAQGMKGIQLTRAEYEAAYTIPIRFTPAKLRGW